jgi:Uma2 family endonuclease
MEKAALEKQPLQMPYEAYRAWATDSRHTEWVNGEVIVYMPPKPRHQVLIEFLGSLLSVFVQFFRLGQVIRGPVEMRATPDGPAREPDILFITREHADRMTDERVSGPADLIVEVISDDSVGRDRGDKFYEYEEAGVREYWILDPRPKRQRADFYELEADGHFKPIPIGADGIYRSAVIPGFWLNVNWLWADEFPDPLLTFAEMAEFPKELVELLEKMREEKEQKR